VAPVDVRAGKDKGGRGDWRKEEHYDNKETLEEEMRRVRRDRTHRCRAQEGEKEYKAKLEKKCSKTVISQVRTHHPLPGSQKKEVSCGQGRLSVRGRTTEKVGW